MKETLVVIAYFGYWIGGLATFGKLTFFSDYVYNWWNWMIAIPINSFLAGIWPLYWGIINPVSSWMHSM